MDRMDKKTDKKEFKSGFVGIIGRTNVGKSTLLNSLVKSKIAITSRRPQTTRHRIRCILTRADAQIIFIDTPGLQKPRNSLGRRLNDQVMSTLDEVDVVLFMLDASAPVGGGDHFIAEKLKKTGATSIAVVNKIDKVGKREVREQIGLAERLGDFADVVPISARSGQNIDVMVDRIVSLLSNGPEYYPEGVVTDQPEIVIVAEFVREKVLELTRQEVPHSVAVVVEEMTKRENKDLVDVSAIVYVERDSQKGIIIGRQGKLLKEIGILARRDIEQLLGSQINLKLWVKVEKDWRKHDSVIRQFGI